MSQERSAEWCEGGAAALEEFAASLEVAPSLLLLAKEARNRANSLRLKAAEASEVEELGVNWEDSDVQAVYDILCRKDLPGGPEEHWEGKVARMVASYFQAKKAVSESDLSRAQNAAIELSKELDAVRSEADEVIHVSKKALDTFARAYRVSMKPFGLKIDQADGARHWIPGAWPTVKEFKDADDAIDAIAKWEESRNV